MNFKNINYGINIVNNSNINLNKILQMLDSKFIKYEINNETDDFINVEVVSQQNKMYFIINGTKYKTLMEIIYKYNVVPKLFSKNLISDEYELKLSKLEHKKDMEKSKIIEKYNSKFNKRFGVTNGLNSIYEWYTGAIFFKDYEWNEIDDNNKLNKYPPA